MLNLASLRIAKCKVIAVFNRKINIPTADEYWNPNCSCSSSAARRFSEHSVLVGTNVEGRGDVYFSLSSVVMFVVLYSGRNLAAMSAMYLV